MNSYLSRLRSLSPQRIFLIDATGALLTFTMLYFILRPNAPYFGMPVTVLVFLACLALIFFLYSSVCFLKIRDRWSLFLKVIIAANTSYFLISLSMVLLYFEILTVLGWIYFMAELIVLLGVIVLESAYLKTANSR